MLTGLPLIASSFASDYVNNPIRAGELAARKRLFGPYSRYAVAPVYTRFDAIEWFVWDAEDPCDIDGLPSVMRQASTLEEALRGLDTY